MDLAPGYEQLHEQTIPQIAVFAVLRHHWPYSGPQAVVAQMNVKYNSIRLVLLPPTER